MSDLVVSVVLVAATGFVLARLLNWLSSQWFLVLLWRLLTGSHPGGHLITDAGWLRPGTKALTRSGHATRYWHLPRVKRAGINLTLIAAAVGVMWAEQVNPLVTTGVLGALTVAALVLAVRRIVLRVRRKTWLLPLHLAAHELVGVPRAALASSWISVEMDDSKAVTGARLALPPGWPAEDKDKQRLVAIASAKLGIEAAEASWRLAGPAPMLSIAQSAPPPARVSIGDIREAIDGTRAHELVWGLGKQSALVKTSLAGDSPHIGLSMGSGAGKSVTARALAAQRLYKGDIALILDYKMISHQWARDLPNVVIARRPHEIHKALMWLGREIERRNEVALAGSDLDGNVHAVVGPRLIVICEELNATMSRLRKYWNDIRDSDSPKRSPAIEALDSASFMGRQILVNIVYIGQRLSVKASGGDGDARENIGVLAFGRYSASNWKMLAGDHPMPAKSLTPGRLQVVTDRVRETQGVFMSALEARTLALAGIVTACPAGMPGAPRVAGETAAEIPGPDLAFVPETGPFRGRANGRLVRLSEAADGEVVSLTLPALRKASQRDRGFPKRRDMDGIAALYDATELALWEAGRKS